MKNIILLIALSFSAFNVCAQNTYTEKLRQNEVGKGVVVINHSVDIERAVNGNVVSKNHADTQQVLNAKSTANAISSTDGGSKHSSAVHPTTSSTSHSKNNGPTEKSDKDKEAMTARQTSHNETKHNYVSRVRHKARGYRICIFTGGNSRADKQKAIDMGNKCRAKFPELASYPSFEAPRWVTHVGDFKTREEAQKYVARIRRTHISYEVRIVRSEVNIPY